MLATEKTGNLNEVKQALEDVKHVGYVPIGECEKRSWYMVIARPGHEAIAADGFRRYGVRAYCPNYERLAATGVIRGGRHVPRKLRLPLIAGHFFSPATEAAIEDVIERVTGAINYARTFSGNPLLLSEVDIAIIRGIERNENTPKPKPSPHSFAIGHKVSFSDDLSGRWPPGKVIKLANGGRITVEVQLMGRAIPISVFPHQIERV